MILKKLKKIVFFDEQAALDFLEIDNEGIEAKVITEVLKKNSSLEMDGKIGKNLLGIFGANISGGKGREKKSTIESQITSTLISSFMNKVNDSPDSLEILNEETLTIIVDSPAYYRNLVPILSMIEDITKLNSLSEQEKENFNGINLEGLSTTLDGLAGYYDMIATNKNGKVSIIRFNITGLRNNYNLNDFAKMDLTLYGIKVGVSTDKDITFNNQVAKLTGTTNEISAGIDFDEENSEDNHASFDIIDIILAGV